ncbi:hypothetical protein BBJ28_00003687 [Nothophytophthora sp. Chile5]|nr:hypothetical protein BBJ28_00003687 [Nothophytophthora sp. Chile5]
MGQQRRELQNQNAELQKRLEGLQGQLTEANQRAETATKRSPQLAWQSKPDGGERDDNQGPSNQDYHHKEKLVEQLRHTLDQKDREIALLQQTVHRECMERTSLLERMRSGKVLPDVSTPSTLAPAVSGDSRNSSTNRRSVNQSLDQCSVDDDDGDDEQLGYSAEEQQPKASFYEKLRRAGHRKTKPRK